MQLTTCTEALPWCMMSSCDNHLCSTSFIHYRWIFPWMAHTTKDWLQLAWQMLRYGLAYMLSLWWLPAILIHCESLLYYIIGFWGRMCEFGRLWTGYSEHEDVTTCKILLLSLFWLLYLALTMRIELYRETLWCSRLLVHILTCMCATIAFCWWAFYHFLKCACMHV